MSSSLFWSRSLPRTKPGRWGRRLLYALAACGTLALMGLVMLAYLALQVPPERLASSHPLLVSPLGKTRLEPQPFPAAEALPASGLGGVNPDSATAYAAFHQTQPRGEELRPDPLRGRLRPKPPRRPAAAKKSKQSS